MAGLLLNGRLVPPSHTHRASNRTEILIGRSLAACVHPLAAWHSRARSFRVLVLAGYFAVGYLTVLMTLAFIR